MKNILTAFVLLALSLGALGIAKDMQTAPVATLQAMPSYNVPIGEETVFFQPADLLVVLGSIKNQKTPAPVMFSHGRDPIHGNAAAGFLKECRITKSGLWCDVVWSAYGRRELCLGAWRFTSPRFGFMREKDNEKNVHPLDLQELSVTNNPAIDGMSPNPVPFCVALPWRPSFPA